ncbi:MAG: FAD-dependent monooxygenase [Promethearchaeota archaeon]
MNFQQFPLGTSENPYDLIIVGAGPAGLAGGITAGRNKLKTIIFEKEDRPSPFPRGETLHNARIFSQILGENVLNLISTHLTAGRKFNSPMSLNSVEVFRRSPSIVYEWNKLIGLLLSRLEETSVELKLGTEVENFIQENNICKGVLLKTGEKIWATSVLVADGHKSKIGHRINIPYNRINFPIMKRIISNFRGDYTGFEYFFLVPGMLEYAPRFPPSVIFVFPRGGEKCEVGLMIFSDMAQKLQKICDIPNEEEIRRVWELLISKYPRFSKLMKNTIVEFEGYTYIGAGQIYSDPMPIPGLFLSGESMGLIEKSGASGIATAMQSAKFAVDFISNYKISSWSNQIARKYSQEFKKSKFLKHLKGNARKAQLQKKFFFLYLRTAERINQKWNLVKNAYKLK